MSRNSGIVSKSSKHAPSTGSPRSGFGAAASIDGSHRAADVYVDAMLTWPLMARGGLVIFDDYLWDNLEGPSEIPKPGIDAFLATIDGQYRTVWNDYQIAIVKR